MSYILFPIKAFSNPSSSRVAKTDIVSRMLEFFNYIFDSTAFVIMPNDYMAG